MVLLLLGGGLWIVIEGSNGRIASEWAKFHGLHFFVKFVGKSNASKVNSRLVWRHFPMHEKRNDLSAAFFEKQVIMYTSHTVNI